MSFLVWGLSLILFFPLVVTDSLFFPFVVGRAIFFRITVEVLFLIYLFLFLRKKIGVSGIFSPIFYAFSAFLALIFIADIFGIDPTKSLLSNYERMDGFITYIHLYLMFILAAAVVPGKKIWHRLLLISISVSAFVSVSEILKFISGADGRFEGPFGNAAYFATYLLFHIFFLALLSYRILAERVYKMWPKFFITISFIAIEIFALYKTATRGSLIALVAGTVVSFFVWVFSQKYKKSKYAIAFVAMLSITAISLGSVFFLKKSPPLKSPTLSRFQELVQKDQSLNPRILVWGIVLKGVSERPIIGWGQDNFPLVFERFYDPRLSLQESIFDRAHNTYLDWAVVAGVPGALAFLIFLGSPFFVLWKKGEGGYLFPVEERIIFTGLLFAYLINILFVFDTLAGLIPLTFFLAYLSNQSSSKILNFSLRPTASKALFVFVFSLVVLSSVFHARVAISSKLLLTATASPEIVEVKERSALFVQALDRTPIDKGRVRREIADFAVSVSGSSVIEETEKQDLFDLGVSELEKEIKEGSENVSDYISLGELFRFYGKKDLAIEYFSQAETLFPSRKNVRKILGDLYFESGRFSESAKTYKALYELESLFDVNDSTYTFYIDNAMADYLPALILSGQSEKAEELAQERFGVKLLARPEIINAYANAGEYDKVVAIWETLLKENPNDPQNFFSLAAAYVKAGMPMKAVKTLKDAEVMHPRIKESAEYYIDLIQSGGQLPI